MVNAVYKENSFPKEYKEGFVKLLNPIAPYMTEELWSILGHNDTIAYEKWPSYDEEKIKEEKVKIAVQVNGKLRATFEVDIDTDKDELIKEAMDIDNVKKYTENSEIVKTIVIPNKIVNIVIK